MSGVLNGQNLILYISPKKNKWSILKYCTHIHNTIPKHILSTDLFVVLLLGGILIGQLSKVDSLLNHLLKTEWGHRNLISKFRFGSMCVCTPLAYLFSAWPPPPLPCWRGRGLHWKGRLGVYYTYTTVSNRQTFLSNVTKSGSWNHEWSVKESHYLCW